MANKFIKTTASHSEEVKTFIDGETKKSALKNEKQKEVIENQFNFAE